MVREIAVQLLVGSRGVVSSGGDAPAVASGSGWKQSSRSRSRSDPEVVPWTSSLVERSGSGAVVSDHEAGRRLFDRFVADFTSPEVKHKVLSVVVVEKEMTLIVICIRVNTDKCNVLEQQYFYYGVTFAEAMYIR